MGVSQQKLWIQSQVQILGIHFQAMIFRLQSFFSPQMEIIPTWQGSHKHLLQADLEHTFIWWCSKKG